MRLDASLRIGLVAASPLLLGRGAAAHDHLHAHDDSEEHAHHHVRPHAPPELGGWQADDGSGGDPLSFDTQEIEAIHHESLHGRIEPDHLHHDHHSHGDVFEGCLLLCYAQMAEKYGAEFADQMLADGFHFPDCPGEDARQRRLGATSSSTMQWNLPALRHADGRLQIPYAIQSSAYFTSATYDAIQQAMTSIEEASGVITFVPRTDQSQYIQIQHSTTYSCAAFVGRMTPTNVYLGATWCRNEVAPITHELLHALGFYHEQSRPDRDDHVSIAFGNVQSGRENNFAKQTAVDSLGSPYDYGSLMHYSPTAFSSNGSPTIVATRTLESWEIMGQRVGLSSKDVGQLRLMYQCSTGPRSSSTLTIDNLCTTDCKCWAYAIGTCDSDDECMGDLECGPTPAEVPKGLGYEDQLPQWDGIVSATCDTYCHSSCCGNQWGILLCPETCGTAPPYTEPAAIPSTMCLPRGLTAGPSESPSASLAPSKSTSPSISPTNCEGPAPCGGIRQWVTLHDTPEACCDAHLYWLVQQNGSYDGCSSLPATTEPPTTPPPTSSPTTRAPSTSPTTAAPSSDPTDSPTNQVRLVLSCQETHFYINHRITNTLFCIVQPTTTPPSASPTTAEPSSSPTDSPSEQPTTPVPSNPPTTSQPTSPPTPKPTPSPNVSPFYIDWASEGGTCKNDGKKPAWLSIEHSTREKCCSSHLSWKYDKCMGVKPAPSGKWFIDWSRGKCVKECERSEGGACGGFKAGNWIALHSSAAACCSAHMSWVKRSEWVKL
ncbi:hypothetical protein ACHAXT_012315 [Thalassiosira profunda]